jgi:signal transduction histidine kinase
MRYMVAELRPALLDDIGLPAALRHYIENFSALTGIESSFTIGKNHTRLPGDVETILFRITQEALTNVARHAHAAHTQIDLHCNNNYAMLKIKDDGIGFDPDTICNEDENSCWGLMGMKERVSLTDGNMLISSETGKGTELIIKVPLVHQENKNGIYKTDAG